ncbi:beta-lactamase domain protein [Chthoniobacter flavus Ellin428]|uniref:Beta-lactamase domain protein n=1 Tax=Chthoniobacter flavus Ellin428 TaxID=497964 RepID=B4D6P0_9BACT|nr:MBL fold metallo-hydrolase [Chthoniobacter flavus]EDY17841.1 beta-lactamase domain protein [Chthoniobacter flavus Ellin428]
MQLDSFTGGIFDTNCFFLLNHGILIDAPQNAADWLQEKGYRVSTLLLTHGHIDHVWDAARIQKEHEYVVAYHADTEQMVTERDFFRSYGYAWDIEPLATPGEHLEESASMQIEGREFQVLLVPGHCPGSLCFLDKEAGLLYGGDTLFAGGVGRWDLPGGDGELLFRMIREKLFKLDDNVTVLPGHGPATKIGIERETNPYVGERSEFEV